MAHFGRGSSWRTCRTMHLHCKPNYWGFNVTTALFEQNFLLDLIFFPLHEFQTRASTLQQTLIKLIVNLLCTESCRRERGSLGLGGGVWRTHRKAFKFNFSCLSTHRIRHGCSRFCSRRVGIHQLWGEGRRTSTAAQARRGGSGLFFFFFLNCCSGSWSRTNSA